MTRNRPLWRWWLFCASLQLWWWTHWEWASDLFAWAVLPEWLGADGDWDANTDSGDDAPW